MGIDNVRNKDNTIKHVSKTKNQINRNNLN